MTDEIKEIIIITSNSKGNLFLSYNKNNFKLKEIKQILKDILHNLRKK